MVEENCQLFSLPISLFYAPRMKFFTVNGYLRIDELIIKTGYPCFQSGEDGERYPAGTRPARGESENLVQPGEWGVRGEARAREGPGIGGLSPLRVACLQLWMLCTLRVSEYPLESVGCAGPLALDGKH